MKTEIAKPRKRSIATQMQPVLSFVEGAAVRWLRAWSDYFGAPFLWFVSFGEAKEINNSRRALVLIKSKNKHFYTYSPPETPHYYLVSFVKTFVLFVLKPDIRTFLYSITPQNTALCLMPLVKTLC